MTDALAPTAGGEPVGFNLPTLAAIVRCGSRAFFGVQFTLLGLLMLPLIVPLILLKAGIGRDAGEGSKSLPVREGK